MILTYCSYACRSIVFLCIIFLLGYIVLKNNLKVGNDLDGSKKVKESFTNRTQDELDKRESIRSVFKNYLYRDPNSDEYEFYSSKMENAGDITTLITLVKDTEEFKMSMLANNDTELMADTIELYKSPLMKQLQDIDANKRLETYKQVIDIYSKVLDRMPNSKELAYFTFKLLKDSNFTTAKLEIILQGSQEYKIKQKNQTNLVNGELSGNITDTQLTYQVRKLYADVFDGAIPSQDIEEFLKGKYVDYNLDDAKLVSLMLLMQQLEANNITTDTNGTLQVTVTNPFLKNKDSSKTKQQETSNTQGTNAIVDQETKYENNSSNYSSSTSTTKNVYQSPNIINIINPTQDELRQILGTINNSCNSCNTTQLSKQSSSVLPSSASCYQKDLELYTDPFTLAMMKGKTDANGLTCSYNKNRSEQDLQAQNRTRNTLAEAIQKRNEYDVKNSCARSSFFLQVDGVTQESSDIQQLQQKYAPSSYDDHQEFGTPLDEAKNTFVGSIMPGFTYKEVSNQC